MPLPSKSKPFSYTLVDIKKLGKGLVIVMVGAGLTFVTEYFAETDFGQLTGVVVAGWSVVVNAFRKWVFVNG